MVNRYLVKYENRWAWSNEFSPEEADAFVVNLDHIRRLEQDWDAEGEELMEQVEELEEGAVYLTCHDWLSSPIAASVNASKDSLLYAIGIDASSQESLESAYNNYPFVYVDDENNYCLDYDNLYVI